MLENVYRVRTNYKGKSYKTSTLFLILNLINLCFLILFYMCLLFLITVATLLCNYNTKYKFESNFYHL